MWSGRRLALAGCIGAYGIVLMVLGDLLMTSPNGRPLFPQYGLALLFGGFVLIVFAIGYALTRAHTDGPERPPRPYPINDPAHVGTVAGEIRQQATLGSSMGSSLGNPETVAVDRLPSRSDEDKR